MDYPSQEFEFCAYAASYKLDLNNQKNKAIYHYTSLATLISIAASSKLRFVDRFFLNDQTEGKYVLSLCIDHIDSFSFPNTRIKKLFLATCQTRLNTIKRSEFAVFQLSFSTDEDNLPLWNYYGASGCNLGFSANDLSSGLSPTLKEEKLSPRLYHGTVIYKEEEQIEKIQKIIDDFYSFYSNRLSNDMAPTVTNSLIEKILIAGIFMKNKCFRIEKEYRFAYELWINKAFANEDKCFAQIDESQLFFERKGMLVPYVDIPFSQKALHSITIAPTISSEDTKISLLRALSIKYPNISEKTIHHSKIPVRF